MPQLIVLIGKEERRISYQPGPSVREILEGAGAQVRTACRGHGACGLCEIRLLGGGTPEPTLNERLHLTRPSVWPGGCAWPVSCGLKGICAWRFSMPRPPANGRVLSGEGFPSLRLAPGPFARGKAPRGQEPPGGGR